MKSIILITVNENITGKQNIRNRTPLNHGRKKEIYRDVRVFHGAIQLLGRLPEVDLIILEGEKCPTVRPSVRPQKVSSISMKFGT